MIAYAQLLIPTIWWDPANGYAGAKPRTDAALELGVGGFILRGGEREAVRALTKDLRQRSRIPLLIAADMERGAGEQFAGATGLPPLAAIASLGDMDAVRRAARLTAREARTMGVNWDFAPVCDLALDAANPIIGTRAFGADPLRVSECAAEWIAACQSEGVLACAKHFPGHGRTEADSHCALPVVRASIEELTDVDLAPFRAAIATGVASLMTAHVAYPALDSSGQAATLSREILHWLLRQRLKFDGLVISDAMTMAGIREGRDESAAVVEAIRAGCDLVLDPVDLPGAVAALELAARDRRFDDERVHQSLRRRLKWAQWASPPNEYRRPSATDLAWGDKLAERVVHIVRGTVPRLEGPVDLVVIDDDHPTPPPSRSAFAASLRDVGVAIRSTEGGRNGALLIALFGDVAAGRGRVGYSAQTASIVAAACREAAANGRPNVVVQFGPPSWTAELADAPNIVSAWGGDRTMQAAAARWLKRAL
jgi:beta-glucosidase-like glycosyl hydrolase